MKYSIATDVSENKMRCAVGVCSNSLIKTKISTPQISYHRFPKNTAILKQWIAACRRKDNFNPMTSVICSIHFNFECFELNFKQELMGVPSRRRLKSDGNIAHISNIVYTKKKFLS